jgi:hypothetical protein
MSLLINMALLISYFIINTVLNHMNTCGCTHDEIPEWFGLLILAIMPFPFGAMYHNWLVH